MLRSASFDTLLSACTHIEQIKDLCDRALYDRYPSTYLTTGVDQSGVDIKSQAINHWTGSRTVETNLSEEFVIVNYVTKVDKAHKASATPWLLVQPLGANSDTPGGIFA